MRISFIIPAFNEAANIEASVNSIWGEMARHGERPCEVIVVNNRSTDKTAYYAERAGAKVVSEWRIGTNQARQTGFDASTGELVAFIDADNRLLPGWLDAALPRFDNPKVVCVAGPYVWGEPKLLAVASPWFFKLMGVLIFVRVPTMMAGNYVVRRSALEAAGGQDLSTAFYGDDTRTAIALSRVGKICYEPKMRVMSSGRRFITQGYWNTLFHYWAIGFLGSYLRRWRGNSQ